MKRGRMPKVVIFAVATLASVVCLVSANTVTLSAVIGDIEEKVNVCALDAASYEEVYEDFLKARTYLSVTVDHHDIATVEEEFAEILGALSIGDTDTAAIAKSRLCSALRHLRRLSGFNIDSII